VILTLLGLGSSNFAGIWPESSASLMQKRQFFDDQILRRSNSPQEGVGTPKCFTLIGPEGPYLMNALGGKGRFGVVAA